MSIIKLKGHDLKEPKIRDSYDRRAIQFKNNIITSLKKLNISEDDIEVPLQKVARIRAPASASWYFAGEFLYISYKNLRFIDNLYLISKVIEIEVEALINKEKRLEEFVKVFIEDQDIEKQRKEARKLLGVEEDCINLETINQKYKLLAKKHHPDMGGNIDMFKKINNAHKILKRELSH